MSRVPSASAVRDKVILLRYVVQPSMGAVSPFFLTDNYLLSNSKDS